MKKWFSLIALAISCLCAHANFYVGGTLGYSSQKSRSSGLTAKNIQYSITPEIGNRINDRNSLGIAFNAYLSANINNDLPDEIILMFFPYYRNIFAEIGNVRFFCELQFGVGSYKCDGVSFIITRANLGPGIMIDLSDKVQLIGRSILIQYLKIGDDFIPINNSFSVMKQNGIFFNKGMEVGIIINL